MPNSNPQKFTIAHIFKFIERNLEEVKPQNSDQKWSYLKSKAAIGLMLEGIELFLKLAYRGKKQKPGALPIPKNVAEWLYYEAYVGVCHSAINDLEHVAPFGDTPPRGYFVSFPFGAPKPGEVPRLVIQKCEWSLTNEDKYLLTPYASLQPQEKALQAVEWYNSRQSPTNDLAKMYLMVEQENQKLQEENERLKEELRKKNY